MSLRLFFALWPDQQARAALARLAQDVARGTQGRAVREENLHLTLAFIGAVEPSQVETLLDAGQRAAERATPFPLTLDRIGGPARGFACLTPSRLAEPLHALHALLADAMGSAGFALQDRIFRPHVTLARNCARSARSGVIEPIGWDVLRLSLVASTLASGGSQYRNTGDWPLGAAWTTGGVE